MCATSASCSSLRGREQRWRGLLFPCPINPYTFNYRLTKLRDPEPRTSPWGHYCHTDSKWTKITFLKSWAVNAISLIFCDHIDYCRKELLEHTTGHVQDVFVTIVYMGSFVFPVKWWYWNLAEFRISTIKRDLGSNIFLWQPMYRVVSHFSEMWKLNEMKYCSHLALDPRSPNRCRYRTSEGQIASVCGTCTCMQRSDVEVFWKPNKRDAGYVPPFSIGV